MITVKSKFFRRNLLLLAVITMSAVPLKAESLEQQAINLSHSERMTFLKGLNPEQLRVLHDSLAKTRRQALYKSDWSAIGEAYWDSCAAADRADLVEAYLNEEAAVSDNLVLSYEEGIRLLSSGRFDSAEQLFDALSRRLYRPDRCHFYLACVCASRGDADGQTRELRAAEHYYAQLREPGKSKTFGEK